MRCSSTSSTGRALGIVQPAERRVSLHQTLRRVALDQPATIEYCHEVESINICETVKDRKNRLFPKLRINHLLHGSLSPLVHATKQLA